MNGELIGGRYQLERLIGQASSARVYRARDSVLGRTVALKLLGAEDDAEAAERFRTEARAAARLVHANLLTVIDRGQEQGRDYVVFEYLGGETLRDRLRREGPLGVREVLGLGIQLASALAFAGEKEGRARDVQAESVLLGEAGQVKLADFAIALDGSVDEDTLPHGEADAPAATTSPAEEPGQDEVRSLGCLLHELLTGLPPAGSGDARQLEERRPDCPERLRRTIERALQEDEAEVAQTEAFASMQELKRELELCRGELERSERRTRLHEAATGIIAAPVAPEPAPPLDPIVLAPPLPAPRRRLHRRLALLLPVLLLGIGAAAYYLTGRGDKAGSGKAATGTTVVHLRAVSAYDPPPGDGQEGGATLAYATDGNPSTAWVTERYNTQHFGNLKSGVGLVVQAQRPVKLLVLVVRTDTPGFEAAVRAGSSASGPFRTVSPSRPVGSATTFRLDATQEARYYVLWITNLSPATGPRYHVDVNEISAG